MSALPPGFTSSGDVSLDRRYRWARSALVAGDAAEARDIAEQTAADAPHWAPAWKLLGEARLACGDRDGARAAFEETRRLDPAGTLGAAIDLARLGALPQAQAMQPGYVAALFDDYADRFEGHLLGALAYRGPEIVLAALRRACDSIDRPLGFDAVVDLGCGTGLMGAAIRPMAGTLAGVDLSAAMLAGARAKAIYDRLVQDDLVAFLAGEPKASADLMLAADTLVYVGDLGPVVAATARVLRPGGWLAFTVQAASDEVVDGFALGADSRYAHAPAHVRAAAQAASLTVAHLAPAVTRQEAGSDVPGLVAVLART